MHKAIFEDRIILDKNNDEIVRIVRARSCNKIIPGLKKGEQTSFDCYKEYETSPNLCRNLYINYYNTIGVEFPKEKVWNYKTCRHVRRGYDEWDTLNYNVNLNCYFSLTEKEKDLICNKYPKFRYVLNKWRGSRHEVMQVLKQWKVYPEIELPLSLGYYNICFSKKFLSMKQDKLKKIYRIMSENKDKNLGISELMNIINYGKEFNDLTKKISRIMGYRVKVSDVEWMRETLNNEYTENSYHFRSDYDKYKEFCDFFEKDFKDEYWCHPKNFTERLESLKAQYTEIMAMREKERQLKKMEEYSKKIKKFLGHDSKIGGYDIVVPTTYEQWEKQANTLNQCILRLNYLDRINDNYVLVFIYKDGEPVATCEVNNWLEKKIGQFYGDEHDRNNCLPCSEIQSAMHTWLDNIAA